MCQAEGTRVQLRTGCPGLIPLPMVAALHVFDPAAQQEAQADMSGCRQPLNGFPGHMHATCLLRSAPLRNILLCCFPKMLVPMQALRPEMLIPIQKGPVLMTGVNFVEVVVSI